MLLCFLFSGLCTIHANSCFTNEFGRESQVFFHSYDEVLKHGSTLTGHCKGINVFCYLVVFLA